MRRDTPVRARGRLRGKRGYDGSEQARVWRKGCGGDGGAAGLRRGLGAVCGEIPAASAGMTEVAAGVAKVAARVWRSWVRV